MSHSSRAIVRRGLFRVLAAACLLLALGACAGNSADELAVRSAVGATMEEISQRTGDGRAFEFMNDLTRQELAAYGVDAEAFASLAIERMTYEVGEVKGDAEKATVSMAITNVNISAAMERATERFLAYSETDGAEAAFDEGGESALMGTLFSYLEEEIRSAEPVTVATELTVTKSDDGWRIDPAENTAFTYALYGIGA